MPTETTEFVEVAVKCGHTGFVTLDELQSGCELEAVCLVCDDYSPLVTGYDDMGAWTHDDLAWLLGDIENETIEF